MAGHTKGPWRVEGSYVAADAGLIVAQGAAYDAAPDDLRLIAAAPELLEAAAKAAVALNNYRATGKPDYAALTEASDAVNAAIAKATESQA